MHLVGYITSRTEPVIKYINPLKIDIPSEEQNVQKFTHHHTAHKSVSIMKTNQLILYTEIFGIYCQIRTKQTQYIAKYESA
jgi:hypothetical protein